MNFMENSTINSLRHWLKSSGKTQAAFAAAIGISQNYLSEILSGKRGVSSAKLLHICERLGLEPSEFYACKAPDAPDFTLVPLVSARPRAGFGGHETEGSYKDWFSFQSSWLRRKGNPQAMRLFCLDGDSMEPTLLSGDMVMIDQSQTRVSTGRIYLVRINDELMLKRLESRPDRTLLKSDNPAYSAIEVRREDESADIEIFGRMVWSCREY